MKRLPAIKKFLEDKQSPLRQLFSPEMEIQVNVGQDDGRKETRTFSGDEGKDITYQYFTGCGNPNHYIHERWKSFRVPNNAREHNKASYSDKELRFSPDHFEAIGQTGWNWVKKQSEYVGFDFDSIANHQQGLSDNDLVAIRQQINDVSWVEVRKSKSGKGLHLYVFFDPAVPTTSHTEHAALARSILGVLGARVSANLNTKVDVCGGVLWIWHRKQAPDGFQLLKPSTAKLEQVPANWRDHLDVVGKKRAKKIRSPTTNVSDEDALDDLEKKTRRVPLDDGHRQVIGWLLQSGCLAWWDADRHLLVAHTYDLLECHSHLRLKGPYYTNSTGKERKNDQNCFCFPLRNSGWAIRRHTRRTPEHPAWSTDSSGWTRCYYNVPADLATACRCQRGVERTDGFFEIPTLKDAITALADLGSIVAKERDDYFIDGLAIPGWMLVRPCLMKLHKDGRAIVKVPTMGTDPAVPTGWSLPKGKDWYERLISIQSETPEIEVPDNFIRHVVYAEKDAGWFMYTKGLWIAEEDQNIRRAMIATGTPKTAIDEIRGQCVLHPWSLVVKPFQPEYPGNRQWNRNAPQLACEPKIGDNIKVPVQIGIAKELLQKYCPTWFSILHRCGRGLNEAIENNEWCRDNEVVIGELYLFLWCCSLFNAPERPLPYLFFYGPQNCGKTAFHEALAILFKNNIGYVKADNALISPGRFNGELKGAVLCVVEETNLSYGHRASEAYNKIKDWVTSRTINIHKKSETPVDFINTTHWIQCANDPEYCPIFPGDTRIVVSKVTDANIHENIAQNVLKQKLEVEAPAFLYLLLNTEIPYSQDRLRLPIIASAEKIEYSLANESPLSRFIKEKIHPVNGAIITIQDFYESYISWLQPIERRKSWPLERVRKGLPDTLVRGVINKHGWCIGNVSFNPNSSGGPKLVRRLDRLVEDI